MANKYRKPFLDKVIARMDFASSINGSRKELPKEVTGTALSIFPISEPRKIIGKEFRISHKGKTEEVTTEETEWIYHSKDRGKSLCVAPTYAYLVYEKYDSFHSLIEDFIPILEQLFKAYKDLQVKRFGLRYINHIKLEGDSYFEWADYLDERLLSMYSLYEGEGEIARGFHNLTINDNDIMLRFQYGMHNPDFPSPIRKKIFILDYDAFYDGLQDMEDIKANIDIFYERIEALFENNIKDELRNLMEPMENGE